MTAHQTPKHGSHRRRPGGRRRVATVVTSVSAVAVLGIAAMHAGQLATPATRIALLHGTSRPTAISSTSRAGDAATAREASSMTATEAGQAAGGTDAMAIAPGHHGGLKFRTIDDPADPTFNQLLGISDSGRLVGYFGSGADPAHPNQGYRVRAPYTHFVDENVPGSVQTQVVAVNNKGVTAGFSVDAAGANTGFVAVNGEFTAVAHPPAHRAHPFDQLLGVNDHGVAVGFYNDAAGAAHGYTYDIAHASFSAVTLPVAVAADAVTATGINNDGDISGFYVTGKTTKGFQLEHTGYFRSLSFGAQTNTQALGIDRADELVGSYLDAAGVMHGFLWSHDRLTTIDDPMGAGGSLVNGLNNRGQLVGFYVDAAGLTHGFLADRHS